MRVSVTAESLLAPALCHKGSIVRSIEALLQIKSDLDFSSYPPVFEDDVGAKLAGIGGYPCSSLFTKNISSLDICVYSGKDVARLVNQILELACEVSTVEPEHVADWTDVVIVPGFSASDDRVKELNSFMQSIVLRSDYVGKLACVVHFQTGLESGSVDFVGVVENIYPDLFGDIPRRIESQVNVVGMYMEHFLSLCPQETFSKATNEYDVKVSYYIGVVKAIDARGEDWTEFSYSSFELGSSYIASMQANQCCYGQRFAGVCFDTVVSLLAGSPKNPEMPFRISEDSDVQRVRLGAAAWRTHVTKKHEGLRLMYWRKDCGGVELANVGNKAELLIF